MTMETLIIGTTTVAGAQNNWTEMNRMAKLGAPILAENGEASATDLPHKNVFLDAWNTTDDIPKVKKYTGTGDFKNLLGIVAAAEGGSESSVTVGANCFVIRAGTVNIDTSGFSAVGALLYPAAGGGFTETAVAGVLPIAIVRVKAVAASGGCIVYDCQGIKDSLAETRQVLYPLPGIATGAATYNFLTFAAPQKMRVTKCYILCDTSTSGSNGANEYRFTLKNHTASNNLNTQKITSAGEITANTVFDLGVNANQDITAGQILKLEAIVVGSPTSLAAAKLVFVIEYQPLAA